MHTSMGLAMKQEQDLDSSLENPKKSERPHTDPSPITHTHTHTKENINSLMKTTSSSQVCPPPSYASIPRQGRNNPPTLQDRSSIYLEHMHAASAPPPMNGVLVHRPPLLTSARLRAAWAVATLSLMPLLSFLIRARSSRAAATLLVSSAVTCFASSCFATTSSIALTQDVTHTQTHT